MDFHNFVAEARTCRRFNENQPLTKQNLDWLIDCARMVPSARNAQLLRYVEILGEKCKTIFPLTHWAMALKDWGGPHIGERPTAFLAILLPKEHSNLALIDAGIAAQTIQLACHSKGFGCCIIKSFDNEKCRTELHVPEDYELMLLLGLGVAKEVRKLAEVPENGSLNYWRDANQVHYVPKRNLSELILATYS
ncbi:MAG: nitroreductase family protein [Desulfovibrio sp.]|nr:nitroreductase family protein [Desulfovibrio sp.]